MKRGCICVGGKVYRGRTWSLNIRRAMHGVCSGSPLKYRPPPHTHTPNLLGDLALQSSFAQGILYLEVLWFFFSFAGLRHISPRTCRNQSQLRVHHSKLSIDFPEWKWSDAAAHWLLKLVVSLARASVSQKDGVSITWGFPFFPPPDLPPPLLFFSLLFLQVVKGDDSPVTSPAPIQGAAGPPSQGRLLLVWHGP